MLMMLSFFSSTPEQHLERLELVLRRLKDANLKLKPSKYYLLQTSVVFLGHVIDRNGISADPAKTELIKEWPVPKNLKQVRAFLGVAGYYRKFVQDYSKIAGPMNHLMKKNQPFIWTDGYQRAFDTLRQALSSPPILALPNNDAPSLY